MATRERVWLDGWELTDGTVRDIAVRDGFNDRIRGLRGDNVAINQQDGVLWRPKPLDQGEVIFNIWVADQTRDLIEDWWDLLIRAAAPQHRLVTILRQMADGGQRQCQAELVDAVQPEHSGQNIVRAAIAFRVPAGVWTDTADTSVATTAGAALPQTLVLTSPFSSATAPMGKLKFIIAGPISQPVVAVLDDVTGAVVEQFVYRDTLATGQTVTIDCGAWTVVGGGGYAGASASKIGYTGRRFLTVYPTRPTTSPTVRLSGGNGAAGTRLTVSGRACYSC